MVSLALTFAESRASLERSCALCEALAPILAESRALVARSRDLCVAFRRRISGGSDVDASFIADIIGKSPMCLDCLARKTGIPPGRLTDSLERIGTFIAVTTQATRCGACLAVTRVYGLDGRPASATPLPVSVPPRPAVPWNEAIWRFLETRRGEMFCTQCIATALSASKRIDRAILGAEGRGALRRYGTCVKCGKERLLCGLAA